MGVFNRLQGAIMGVGIGAAARDAVAPSLEVARQSAWGQRAAAVLDANQAAQAVAQGIKHGINYADDAKRNGLGANRFKVLVDLARTYPGAPDVLAMWRRDPALADDAREALERHGYPEVWIDAMLKLKNVIPPPSDMIRFGVREVYNPELRAELELDAEFPEPFAADAARLGFSRDRAGQYWAAHWELPSYGQLSQMLFRDELTPQEFRNALKALDYAPTWRGKLEAIARAIPTITDFQRLVRRGVYGGDERAEFQYDAEYPAAFTEKMALHGMSEPDARDLWAGGWKVPSAGQLYKMLWRGEISEAQMRKGLKALDYSPFWRAPLANIARPTLGRIDIRRMYAAGILTRDEALDAYGKIGFDDQDAQRQIRLAETATDTGAKEATAADELALYDGDRIERAELVRRLEALGYDQADANRKADVLDARRVTAARTTAIGAVRASYVKHELTDNEAGAALTRAGVAEWAQQAMLAAWDVARDATRAELTVAEVTRAYRRDLLTQDAAVAELVQRGYSPDEARTLLGLTVPTLTVRQVTDAFKAGIRTREEAAALLAGMGFAAADIALLLGAIDPNGEAAAIAAAVKAGTLARAAAVAQLVALGYSAPAAEAFLDAGAVVPPATGV